ncbi:hypothetical protein [Streptomyces sp. NPDC059639]|uniref:hypothetical protein n=1 Tax=Streptomyces sp. NPDC059639 TaxID=3346891 RepID=UPI0036755C52
MDLVVPALASEKAAIRPDAATVPLVEATPRRQLISATKIAATASEKAVAATGQVLTVSGGH